MRKHEKGALERDQVTCAQKQAVEIQRLKSIVRLCEAELHQEKQEKER